MNKFRLEERYCCSVVRGCSNKAAIFEDMNNNRILCCKLHRLTAYASDPKSMFTQVIARPEEEITGLADFGYNAYSKEVVRVLYTQNFESLSYARHLFNYLFKEINLYKFYNKLAHFQVPTLLPSICSYSNYNEDFLRIGKDIIIQLAFGSTFKSNRGNLLSLLRTIVHKNELDDLNSFRKCSEILKLLMKVPMADICGLLQLKRHTFHLYLEVTRLPDLASYLSPMSSKLWGNLKKYTLTRVFGTNISCFSVPASYDHYYEMALSLHRIGDYKESLKLLKMAKDYEDKNELNLSFGMVYSDLGIYHKSLTAFQNYIQNTLNPDPACYVYISDAYAKMGKYKKARHLLDIARRNDSSRIYELEGLLIQCRAQHYIKAANSPIITIESCRNILHRQYKYHDFLACLFHKRLLVEFFESLLYFDTNFYRYMHCLNKRYDEMSKSYNFDHPKNLEVHLIMAKFHKSAGNYQKSFEMLSFASLIEKNYYKNHNLFKVDILLCYANLYLKQEKHEKAKEYIDELSKIKPKYKKILNHYSEFDRTMGNYYRSLGSLKEACRHYSKAMKIDKKNLGKHHPFVVQNYLKLGSLAKELNVRKKYFSEALKLLAIIYIGKDQTSVSKNLSEIAESFGSASENCPRIPLERFEVLGKFMDNSYLNFYYCTDEVSSYKDLFQA